MIIEYLYIHNRWQDKWIKGPFTQQQLTRYASACSYTVSKGLREQMELSDEDAELLRNACIGVHAVDVPCGMRNFNDTVSEMDEHWFYFYWHKAGEAVKYKCKDRFDYFRSICLQFKFIKKLPTYEQYNNWSSMWDDTYNGSFDKKDLRVRGWMDSERDPKFKAQFAWVKAKEKPGVDYPILVKDKKEADKIKKRVNESKANGKYSKMSKIQLIERIKELERSQGSGG